MITGTLKRLGAGLAALVLMFGLTNSARAILVIGDPIEGGSWAQRFILDVSAGTHMEAFMRSPAPDAFEAPGFANPSVGGWTTWMIGSSILQILASGNLAKNMQFDIRFAGSRSNPLVFDFYEWNAVGVVVDKARASWSGSGWSFSGNCAPAPSPTPIPEPTTMIAGALLLLPFGASTVRFFRKQRVT